MEVTDIFWAQHHRGGKSNSRSWTGATCTVTLRDGLLRYYERTGTWPQWLREPDQTGPTVVTKVLVDLMFSAH